MPKNRSKNNKARGDTSDLDQLECASIISLASEDSNHSSLNVEDASTIDSIIQRVNMACEDLTEKRPETRVKALTFILESYQMHCLCLDYSWNYLSTFLDGIEYVIKKGKPQDQTMAADCLATFCFQFDSNSTAELFAKFLPLLDPVIRDVGLSVAYRSACVTALALMQFFSGCCDFISSADLMKVYESIFRGSYIKGDGKAPVLDPAVAAFHVAALKAWALLYSILPTQEMGTLGKAMLPNLISLLRANSVEMRIISGEAAVLIYERVRNELDGHFKGPYYNSLVTLLSDLATDGTKHRSKMDRKKQRRSFRDLTDALISRDTSETTVSLGSEVLTLTTCVEHLLYNILCCLLKGGVSRHLQENCQVRDLFGLGPVVIQPSLLDRRLIRDQRRLTNSVAGKIRTQKLGSCRDQRSNVLNDSD